MKIFILLKTRLPESIISDKMQDTQQTNSSWVKGEPKRTDRRADYCHKKDSGTGYYMGARKSCVSFQCSRNRYQRYYTYVEDLCGIQKRRVSDRRRVCGDKLYIYNLPMGKYTVSEKKTLRYVFESITAQTSNVSLNDRNGIAVLDRNNKVAAVTFTNKKTRYDRYSHTDVVRNQIHIQN